MPKKSTKTQIKSTTLKRKRIVKKKTSTDTHEDQKLEITTNMEELKMI